MVKIVRIKNAKELEKLHYLYDRRGKGYSKETSDCRYFVETTSLNKIDLIEYNRIGGKFKYRSKLIPYQLRHEEQFEILDTKLTKILYG